MAAIDWVNTSRHAEFQARVRMMMFKVAQVVAVESPTTNYHAERLAYCKLVANGGDNVEFIAAHMLTNNPTLSAKVDASPTEHGSNITDAELQSGLTTIWTARSMALAP